MDKKTIGKLCLGAAAAVGVPLFLIGPGQTTKRQRSPFYGLNFAHRGLQPELRFYKTGVYDAASVCKVLRGILAEYPDAAIDITGGTDAVLFAAGMLSAEMPVPVFTYSRRKNRFFDIRNADFAAALPCTVTFTVEDCFRMAGGSMRPGRVDNGILGGYLPDIEPFFQVYLRHRRHWNRIVTYIQRLSPALPGEEIRLEAKGGYRVKGERGSELPAPEEALGDLEQIGLISDLEIVPEQSVAFRFRDAQIRAWLRDVGSVLELYVYKVCLDLKLFDDVRTSAVVDWEGDARQNAVTNELDVMATRGVIPVFISCKTCDVRTEALNELAILRDRFGGKVARAAIVTAEPGGAPMRNRAGELGIEVVDLSDLEAGRLGQRLGRMMQAR